MRKVFAFVVVLAMMVCMASEVVLADGITIAIPAEAGDQGRALMLLEEHGLLKLDESAGYEATIADITDNPLGIRFKEVDSISLPVELKNADYGIIPGPYALSAGLADPLLVENASSPFVQVVTVRESEKETGMARALAAAVCSSEVEEYLQSSDYAVSVIDNPTDGYDPEVDYTSLKGKTMKVVSFPGINKDVIEIAGKILAQKGITLDIVISEDLMAPNDMVNSGKAFANFFATEDLQTGFGMEKGTLAKVFLFQPGIGLYAGKQTTLDPLGFRTGDEAADLWVCTQCGNQNEGGKYCTECGTARDTQQVCTKCGFVVEEGKEFKYCPECGTKF